MRAVSGMILVNVTPDSVDADLDAVPTVHIDAAHRDALLAGAESGATATLVAGNLTDVAIPSPQIAPFSGRGPVAEGDVLTPDVAAPGVDILAATHDTPAGDAAWDIASGTSMAAPHVAGLAARYLAARPDATPDEIKSALMTTASDTVNADGSAGVDPFAQGAGQVDGERLLDPGLLYLNGQTQWFGFLREHGHAEMDVLDPSGDVNLASISIPQLGVKQIVDTHTDCDARRYLRRHRQHSRRRCRGQSREPHIRGPRRRTAVHCRVHERQCAGRGLGNGLPDVDGRRRHDGPFAPRRAPSDGEWHLARRRRGDRRHRERPVRVGHDG